ncbi:MAG: hypothetical protein N3H30_00440 [Candidatus Micrarchaeota archaeon]|nr:hypothetical protein [Candidatus Micrarchaeota archaeon]
MIVSRRIKVPRGDVPSDKLLEHIQEYLRNHAGGKVLRYAVVDASGKDFVVDLSVREDTVRASSGSGEGHGGRARAAKKGNLRRR